MKSSIATIIVHWGVDVNTDNCISFLFDNYQEDVLENNIIIVNNNKDPYTPKINSINATVINNNTNLGYAKAVNIGISQAIELGKEFILLLNNDCTIDRENIIKCVSEFKNNKRIAAINPRILRNNSKDIWYNGGIIYLDRIKHFQIQTNNDYNKYLDNNSFFYITGACLFLRISSLIDIGFFDDKYFLYWEDADISYRLHQAGYHQKLLSEAIAYHEVSKSSGGPDSFIKGYYINRNQLIFYFDHLPFLRFLKLLPGYLIRKIIFLLKIIKENKFKLALFSFLGITSFFLLERGKSKFLSLLNIQK